MFEPNDTVVLLDYRREIVDFGDVISINEDAVVIRSMERRQAMRYALDMVDVLKYQVDNLCRG